MDARVRDRSKKDRSQRLLALSEAGKRAYGASLVGSTVNVLFEEDGSGLTDTYVRVAARGGTPNTFGRVLVTAPSAEGVLGSLVDG